VSSTAGLLLLLPAMAQIDLSRPGVPRRLRLPPTADHSVAVDRLPCCWPSAPAPRADSHHIDALTDDAGSAFCLGLTALARRHPTPAPIPTGAAGETNQKLLTSLVKALPHARIGQRHRRIQPRLPRHPATTRGRHRAGETLRAAALPTHPRRAHLLLRPGTTRPPRWSTPTPRSPKPSRAHEIIAFADYWPPRHRRRPRPARVRLPN